MDVILVILVAFLSFLVGIAVSYGLLEKRLNQQEQSHQTRLRQQRDDLERSYAERLQAQIEALSSQYETQIQQLKTRPGDKLNQASRPDLKNLSSQPLASTTPISSPSSTVPSSTSGSATLPKDPPSSRFREQSSIPVFESKGNLRTSSGSTTASTRPTLSQLIDQSKHPNTSVRLQLIEQLGQSIATGQPKAMVLQLIPYLAELSRDAVPEVRQNAILALGQIQSPKVLPFLRRALKDTDLDVVKAASVAIKQINIYPSAKKSPKRKVHNFSKS